MATVFISYSHLDGSWVTEWLLPRLESTELKVHIDVRDFTIGQPALINMEKAVIHCDYTILVLSPHWLTSQWTIFESLLLMHEGPTNLNNRMLPLLLEKCSLPPRLNMFTYADFTCQKSRDIQLSRMLKQLGISYTPTATPLPETNISLDRLPLTGEYLFGREKELTQLHEAWTDPQTDIISLVAWGGVGKTALVNQWLNEMKQQHYGGAQKIFGWSFYSQGATEGTQVSADDFFRETLLWFGDRDPQAGSAVDKGRRLAGLVQKQKTLLVLDGLEPMQYPPGEVTGLEGRLKDPGLATFLKVLAVGGSGKPGLCVITTREPITDLKQRQSYGVKEILLEKLSTPAGVLLLKSLGVTQGSPLDLEKAVTEYEGHGLALTLLGLYIKNAFAGDIRRRDEIPLLEKERQKGCHAQQVMAAHEKRFGPSPERDILFLLGLFDRPVPRDVMAELLKEPVIPGVTDGLSGILPEDWQYALTHLREAGLLGADHSRHTGTLDCHPLVREHFGAKLSAENPAGWQQAHMRLYLYFKNLQKKESPETLEEMEPLFAAIGHGCKAGLHQEVMDEVFWKRIRRGNEFYTWHKLGAFGSDLAALSYFFALPWSQPVTGLREATKAAVLGWAAFGLRAVGRLQEAIQPTKAGLELRIQQKDWKNAAIGANNLSQLRLTLGDVPGAMEMAQQSVAFADRSGDDFEMESNRTTLAEILHWSGAKTEAEKWFREAEAKQKQRRPQFPFLYSLPGYRFCDLLLENQSSSQVKKVIARAEKFFEWRKPSDSLLSISLENLIVGRAWMKLFSLAKAKTFLEEAVEGLREAGAQEFLVRGLLAHAEYYRHTKEYAKAHDDLNEVLDIAELGGMKLHLCDYHLESHALCVAEGKMEEAVAHEKAAEVLIKETGYGKRGKLGN